MNDEKAYSEITQWLDDTRDEPLEGMASFFDRRVGSYEAHMSPWSGHYRHMAELLPPKTRALLDLGCGTGLELDPIFEKYPALTVTGIDLSADMLAALKRKHPDKAMTLIQGDYLSYDYGEAMFDAVIAFETLHHFDVATKTELYRKLRRALKPGCWFIECDYIALSPRIEALLFAENAARRARDNIAPGVFAHFDTPLTIEHELSALSDAGFIEITPPTYLPGNDNTAFIRAKK